MFRVYSLGLRFGFRVQMKFCVALLALLGPNVTRASTVVAAGTSSCGRIREMMHMMLREGLGRVVLN